MLHSTIEKIVIDTYEQNGIVSIRDLAIENISRLLWIDLSYTDKQSSSYRFEDYVAIRLHRHIARHKQVWQFFHECGHLFIHDVNQLTAVRPISQFMEIQAYRFALYASMPHHILIQYISKYYKISDRDIAHIFQVPMWAAQRRLEQIKSRIIQERLYLI